MRGLCIAAGRLADARDILLEWAQHVSQGMLPNFFPDGGGAECTAVVASLRSVVAVHELLAAPGVASHVTAAQRERVVDAVLAIVAAYSAGTRFGIRMDSDGLLAAGV